MAGEERLSRDAIMRLPVEDRGPWISTRSGGMWSLVFPAPEDVKLVDIAAGLSRECRYGGQLRDDVELYSVAEHSVLMTEWAMKNDPSLKMQDALFILMHDASEAYLGDMTSPLKRMLPDFQDIEATAEAAIHDAFRLHPGDVTMSKRQLKDLDEAIRIDEVQQVAQDPARLLSLDILSDGGRTPPLGVTIRGLAPNEARQEFMGCIQKICEVCPFYEHHVALRADLHDIATRDIARMQSIRCDADFRRDEALKSGEPAFTF